MKFAVVEYSSKSGQIWRHTSKQPNFLANPHTEIDPTSFGGYVSALEGEHIPLLGLIKGPVAKVMPWQKLWRRAYKKIFGVWPNDYDIEYLRQFDVILVVHQISDGADVTCFTKRLKKTFPHLFVLGVPTQPYGILKDYWEKHPAWFADFQDYMNSCDVFMTIVEETLLMWEELTKTPVIYLPQPYPVEYAEKYFTPQSQKQKVIFVAGVTDRDNIRRGQTVARELQKRLSEYVIHVTDTPGLKLDLSNLAGAKFSVEPFAQWREHLEYLRTVSLVVNTDYTYTRGRVQADCAAVGTPSIGANSDGQRDLFPGLPVSFSSSVEELVSQGERLLTDSRWYEETAVTAKQSLQKYNYTQSAARIEEIWRLWQSDHD